MSYEAETLAGIQQAIRSPLPPPKTEPKFSAWSLVSAIPRGLAEAGAQGLASLSEIASGYSDVMARMETGESMQTRAPDMQSAFADALRERGREMRPDPETAHAAEQVLYGFARGAGKIVAGGMAGGPVGVGVAGAEEAMTQNVELERDGVTDPAARLKAASVQGAGLALAALPLVGGSLKATAGLYLAGGPGGFMAQQAITREILSNAGFDKQAAQYDPLDPVGLAMSALIPLPFVAAGVRAQRAARSVPDVAPEVVDAARVAYDVEQRAAASPAPVSIRSAEMHEQALSKAEEQIALGEPVSVTDVAPTTRVPTLAEFAAGGKFSDPVVPPEVTGDFVSFIQKAGGIDIGQKFDITGDRSGVLSNPGGIFRSGGRGVDDLALQAEAAGYLRPGEGDSARFVEMVQQAIRGERVLNFEQQMRSAERDAYMRGIGERMEAAEQKLRLLGVDPVEARGRLGVMEAYLKANEPRLLGAALDEARAADEFSPEAEAMQAKARQIAADIQESGRTVAEYEADITPLSPAMRRLVTAEMKTEAPEPPKGKPRDLRAEVIGMKKRESVLTKLMDCLA